MFLRARGEVAILAGGAARKAVTVATPLLGGRSSSIAATPVAHLQPDRALGDRLAGVVHHAARRAMPPSSGRWQSTVTRAASQAIVDVEATVVDDRIPVTVITGFLGSGKTTLLNHILSQDHGRRIAVIENEFGEIDIDSSLITKKEVVEGTNDTITTLSNGCLCCTVRDDLIKALNKLWRRRKDFDHIIIETTGMASPGPIISSFYVDPDLPKRVKLDGVVTVVDAKHVVRHLDEEKPEDVVNEAVEQIAYADRIILNKTDLVQEPAMRQLESRLREINKLAMVQRAQRSVVAVDYVLGVGGFDLRNVEKELDVTLGLNKAAAHSHDHDHDHHHDHDHEHSCGNPTCTNPDHHHEHDHAHAHDDHAHEHGHSHAEAQHSHEGHSHEGHSHSHEQEAECHDPKCTNPEHQHSHEGMSVAAVKHDDKITSVSLVFEGDMDIDKINYSLGFLLESRADDIYRMKGILAIKDSEFRFVYQGVHMLFEGVPDRKWLPNEKRVSKMVFIGRYLHKEDFEEAFRNCLAVPEPSAQAAAPAPTPAGAAV